MQEFTVEVFKRGRFWDGVALVSISNLGLVTRSWSLEGV